MTSPGAWQTTLKGIGDGFIAAFYGSGQRRWSSYYGGAVNDFLRTIVALPDKKVVAGGGTGSTGMATRHGFQQSLAGPPNGDGLVAMFDSLGQLVWCSYLGGSFTGGNPPSNNGDPIYSSSLCLEKDILYVAGPTISNTGLATPGAYLAVNNVTTGVTVPFIAQIGLNDTLVYIRHSFTDSFACVGDTLRLPYGVTRNFRSNNVFTVQLSNSSGSFSSPTNLKTINSNTADTAVCVIPAGVADGTGYRIRIVATAPVDTSEPNRYDIKVYHRPANFTASSNSPLCSSDTLKLNSGSTTTGVTYSWAGPVSFSSADDDTIIANTNVGHTGDYYITVNNNGCMVKDTVSVTVDQTPENVTAGNNGPLCSGDTLKLTSSTTTSGVSYTWTGPNNYNTQNVTRPNAQLSDAGTYKVTVTLGSCSDTEVTSVVVNQSPTINIAPLTPVSICTGDTAQFAAFSNNAGTNPQYQWLKNGVAVAGATGTSFKTGSLANGDVISVQLTPNTNCPGTKESNKITMTVQPILSPTVTMTADKMPPWNGGLTVTFTANPTHGGTAPEYQWKRNGADVVGATGTSWGVVVNALNANEDICVVLKSSYECAVPDTALSNCITTAFTGIGDIVNNKNIKIYPNPVSGNLHIEGVEAGVTIELIDVLGRSTKRQFLSAQGTVDVSSLVPGVYVVRVNGVVAGRVVKE
jgi:hypothetical protein